MGEEASRLRACIMNDMTSITATQLLHIHNILMKDGQGLRCCWPLPVLSVFWSDVREYLASLGPFGACRGAVCRPFWGLGDPLGGLWGWSWVSLGGSSGYLGVLQHAKPSRSTKEAPKRSPGWAQEAPRGPRRPPKGSQETPKKAQEAPKTLPKQHQR